MWVKHFTVAEGVQKLLRDYKLLQDIIAILGIFKLPKDDKLTITRARKIQKFLSQTFFMSEIFTDRKGKIIELEGTIEGFSVYWKER